MERKEGDIITAWRALAVDYIGGVEIAVIHQIWGGPRKVAKPVVFEYEEVGEHFVTQPTFILTEREAKTLMQSLWDAGIRPDGGHGSHAQISALQAHINFAESMVSRVFNQLERGTLDNETTARVATLWADKLGGR